MKASPRVGDNNHVISVMTTAKQPIAWRRKVSLAPIADINRSRISSPSKPLDALSTGIVARDLFKTHQGQRKFLEMMPGARPDENEGQASNFGRVLVEVMISYHADVKFFFEIDGI